MKVCNLPFITVVKIWKSNNPKRSYMDIWPLGYWEVWNREISFQSLGFIIGSIANWAKNHQNYTIYASHFDLKLSAVHLKHIQNLWFCNNLKIAEKSPPQVYSAISGTFSLSPWGLAQKHLILIGCITNMLVLYTVLIMLLIIHVKRSRPYIWRMILQVWRTA